MNMYVHLMTSIKINMGEKKVFFFFYERFSGCLGHKSTNEQSFSFI